MNIMRHALHYFYTLTDLGAAHSDETDDPVFDSEMSHADRTQIELPRVPPAFSSGLEGQARLGIGDRRCFRFFSPSDGKPAHPVSTAVFYRTMFAPRAQTSLGNQGSYSWVTKGYAPARQRLHRATIGHLLPASEPWGEIPACARVRLIRGSI